MTERISDLQPAYIRKIMSEILFRKPLNFKSLIATTVQKLTPNVPPTREELMTLKDIVLNMLIEGKTNISNGVITLNSRFRTNSVEEDYKLSVKEADSTINIDSADGATINSVGSERLISLWTEMPVGKVVTVTLIAEPDNRKDPNAVAICIDGKPYAYFPREEAYNYQKLVLEAAEKRIALECTATATYDSEVYPVKYFELNLLPKSELESIIRQKGI